MTPHLSNKEIETLLTEACKTVGATLTPCALTGYWTIARGRAEITAERWTGRLVVGFGRGSMPLSNHSVENVAKHIVRKLDTAEHDLQLDDAARAYVEAERKAADALIAGIREHGLQSTPERSLRLDRVSGKRCDDGVWEFPLNYTRADGSLAATLRVSNALHAASQIRSLDNV